jgi:hypothetical protein|nr:MAG TPA: hypothetical protein [Caudoviricetes sp.]
MDLEEAFNLLKKEKKYYDAVKEIEIEFLQINKEFFALELKTIMRNSLSAPEVAVFQDFILEDVVKKKDLLLINEKIYNKSLIKAMLELTKRVPENVIEFCEGELMNERL